MSRQFRFCANENDDVLFLEIIKKIFPNPYFVSDELKSGNYPLKKIDINPTLFTDKNYLDCLKYFDYQDFNNNIEKVLDKYKSPVIEYSKSIKHFKNDKECYGFGRFYCAFSSKDKEFSKEVSTLFRLLKKEFYYFKEHSLYVSKNIDLDTAYFYLNKEYRQLKF